jgi:hypothetical protein
MSDEDEYEDCDAQSLFDPRSEVPAWFWKAIASGQQNRDIVRTVLSKLSRKKLQEFIECLDELGGFFCESPFVPPHPPGNSQHHLQETGIWAISQGKRYFLGVWDHPERFWELLAENVVDRRSSESYLGVAEEEWWHRYPGEESP